MKSEDIVTVGDLIQFLQQYNPELKVMVYDNEYGLENPLQHIDIETDRIIMYD